MSDFKYKQETYSIIGACMEVHRLLGPGLKEILYKDAIELELRSRNIFYERERKYEVLYKGIKLPHYYYSDFVVDQTIILEAKATSGFCDEDFAQIINYLSISNCGVGLLVNFGRKSLQYKRFVPFDR